MDNHLPFGYEHRQKRSHDMMEGSAGPTWSFESLTPFTRLGVPREHSVPRPQESSQADRRGSSARPYHFAASGHRARTPDAAAMRARYPTSRESANQANDRSPSAGPANRTAGGAFAYSDQPAQNMERGQTPRFEGDGFDMRRPVGWQGRAEGSDRASDRHMVEISDGDDDLIIVDDDDNQDGDDVADYNALSGREHRSLEDMDGDDIAEYNAYIEHEQRNREDVVDLTEEDDAPPAYNWQPRNDRHHHNQAQARSRPPAAERPGSNDAPRLPRGMAGIINLDNGEETWTVDDEPVVLEPSSPEIQFVSARRLDSPNRPAPPPRRNDSDGDDVQFVQARPLTELERRDRQRAARHAELDRVIAVLGETNHDRYSFAHLRGEIDRANAHIHHLAEHMRHGGPTPPPRVRRGNHIQMGIAHAGGRRAGIFVAPDLNFGMVGFELGYGRRRPEPSPPPPTYVAPPPAPEGFTRSPEENDVLVCPNCDSELCKGDDDVKKQVWIAKQCGHIYCGECAANRSAKGSAKGKEKQAPPKTQPFKVCVVEGCGKKVQSPKSMFQVFML